MKPVSVCRTVAIALLALSLSAPAAPAAEHDPWGTLTLQLENDRLARTDRHYTHGTRVTWISETGKFIPDRAGEFLDWLYGFVGGGARKQIGYTLGQNIYTPEDISRAGLIADDRPYAGWLYVGLSLHATNTETIGAREFDVLDTMEVDVGIVGPQSFAEDVQTAVHEVIGVGRANGWDNQLKNEPGIVVLFERKWRPRSPFRLGVLEVDAIPHAGASLGNIWTGVNVGMTVRLGQDLSVDFGPPHIRPNLSGLESFDYARSFAWYLFAGAEGRLVARNIFLDGNTFADSHSVSKERLVGDFPVGLAVVIDRVRIAFTHAFRTREFKGQSRSDRFGALSVSWKF